MNDTLRDQCRREAEERYPMPVFESGNYVHTTDVAIAHAVVSARQESHAAALYAERSKRPPDRARPSDDHRGWLAMIIADQCFALTGEPARYEFKRALTAAANNNTNDNG
jgi:hypothetical protein